MNLDTNELVNPHQASLEELHAELEAAIRQSQDAPEDLRELVSKRSRGRLRGLKANGFVEVPAEMDHAARCALKGRSRTTVSRVSKGKLSKWAAAQRRGRR